MSEPVKLSDQLVLEARTAGSIMERSIAGQVEFWAGLGKAVEPLLRGHQAQTLKAAGKEAALEEILASVDTAEGRQRVHAYLATRPYPHFEASSDGPGVLIRIDEDGTRTRGRFVDRQFVAEP
jgi:hypothetical protein